MLFFPLLATLFFTFVFVLHNLYWPIFKFIYLFLHYIESSDNITGILELLISSISIGFILITPSLCWNNTSVCACCHTLPLEYLTLIWLFQASFLIFLTSAYYLNMILLILLSLSSVFVFRVFFLPFPCNLELFCKDRYLFWTLEA